MSRDPFVHLRVASGHSLQYGASSPAALVEQADQWGMDLLALTDRDGLYGAVKFARAASAAGIRPVLGVDLAVRPASAPTLRRGRQPIRGGAHRDRRWPRVTVLARDRIGWAALCRLVSDVHLGGERGAPVADLPTMAPHLAGGHLVVLLGPGSEVGASLALRRDDEARDHLARWARAAGRENLRVELVSHRRGATEHGWGPGSTPHAARMAGLAEEQGVDTVLSNAVRHARRSDAPVVDVLDAARRLVPLDARHLDRANAEGHLKSGAQMAEVADEICRAAGHGADGARRLLRRTRALGEACALDPADDLGIGGVHFPEFEVVRRSDVTDRGVGATPADAQLRARCESAVERRYGASPRQRIWKRLDDELSVIETLGYASYFLTVGEVTDLVRDMGVRCAARGSGAGSLVNYLLGISGVDPLRHDLLMERFLSPLRSSLPDIDVDVDSARRAEVYEAILERFGGDRCVCVSMTETYRVRHAVRDVGAALGLPPGEVDAIAKAFPHVRARDARAALRDLPELRSSGLGHERLDLMFALVERLDGLPRHIAVHPCGVLLSDATLLDRTPVEASAAGYPMSQFDKDDVEDLGLLKLDVLGIRMQSAMSHAVAEIRRVDGVEVDLDDEEQVPLDDPATYDLISSAKTLGVFQIESPGQRELVGKSGIETFEEVITDISLFRPGPVKSDMVTPYLEAKQGWRPAVYPHPDLRPILASTHGVVVFHEQVIEIFARLTGITFAEADEKRRAMGSVEGVEQVREWFLPVVRARGYEEAFVDRIWKVLAAFASFGFCKAHAAAFALPTFQSAWLKTHWPAHFLAGVLTHDPGMYPKRLILDDARQCGVGVLPLDVNLSAKEYVVEPSDDPAGHAIRLALGEVKGISDAEVDRILAARPFVSLADLWQRARTSRPVVERLVLAGALDQVHGIAAPGAELGARTRTTRRDLLLRVAELERGDRADRRQGRGRRTGVRSAASADVRDRAAAQVRPPRPAALESVQLSLDVEADVATPSGLPELSLGERTAAELEILGLDVSSHVLSDHDELLDALGVVRSRDLLRCRSRSEVLVAGVKVATQTPPIRSGRRVVFLTLDDSTGPVDATFFEDAQGPWAGTVFSSWLLLVRGVVRRTGHRGVSVRATGAWALPELQALWSSAPSAEAGLDAMRALLAQPRRVEEGAPNQRRVLVHSSGFRMSPYADIAPADVVLGPGGGVPARGLWHRSPGSPG
ncbi:DNA polymerase III subunit alpha [Nocardioides malaquae]|uniref:DNA polymerase III subunit alpha n=1 Tax=Nocardioides malaquae TaxID=2773426 RepID=UPI0029D41440|nr:DNA polymerase III subunit alpha [Nocardioides malaquae]